MYLCTVVGVLDDRGEPMTAAPAGSAAIAPLSVADVPLVHEPIEGPDSRGPTIGNPDVARSLHTTAVVTPEAVLLEFRAAGVASRLLAKVIDLGVQLVMLFVVFLLMLLVSFASTVALVLLVVGVFAIQFGYPMIEAVWDGATVGKKVLGLRVITLEGGPVKFRHAAIRSLVWVPEAFIPPGGITALTAALLTRRSQRIGDLAAGTVVIRIDTANANPTFFAPARNAEEFSQRFDASRLAPAQYALLREFLLRADQLDRNARHKVAAQLAAGVQRATGVERPVSVAVEGYVVASIFAYQHRFGPTAPLATSTHSKAFASATPGQTPAERFRQGPKAVPANHSSGQAR